MVSNLFLIQIDLFGDLRPLRLRQIDLFGVYDPSGGVR